MIGMFLIETLYLHIFGGVSGMPPPSRQVNRPVHISYLHVIITLVSPVSILSRSY